MWILRWIFVAILIIIVLGFALQNQEQKVSVSILKWQSDVLPLYFFLYFSYVAGLLTWVLVSTLSILKKKGEILKLQRENRRIREELNRLRNVSIDEDIESTELEQEDKTLAEDTGA